MHARYIPLWRHCQVSEKVIYTPYGQAYPQKIRAYKKSTDQSARRMTYPDYCIQFLKYLRPLPAGYLRLLPGADRHPCFHTGMYLQHETVGGQSGEGERRTSDTPHSGGRHPPWGRPSATPTASNAGPHGCPLWNRCWVPTPAPTAPGTHGSRYPGCPPQKTGGRGRDSA